MLVKPDFGYYKMKVLDFKISEIKVLSYPQVEHTLQGKESGQELNRMMWRILMRG